MLRSKTYSQVRIVHLIRPDTDYDGWAINQRAPKIGDIGYLIDVLDAANLPSHYVVEMSDPEGITIWLAEFLEEELEALE